MSEGALIFVLVVLGLLVWIISIQADTIKANNLTNKINKGTIELQDATIKVLEQELKKERAEHE